MTNLNEITYIDWQLRLNTIGSVAEGVDDINQCIAIILTTPKGSVPHRPTFGSDIHKYVDYPVNEIVPNITRETIDAINLWETRVTVNSVSVEINQEKITVKIEWTLKDSNTKGTKEWIELYEQKSGKVIQPAQIERLMVDVGAYRETILRMKIQETAKQNLLSYAPLDILEHIGEPLGVTKLLANSAKTTLKFSVEKPLDFDFRISKGTEVETKDGLFIFQTTSDTILKTGELSVEVESVCETAGAGGNNYIIGSIDNLITPLSYISTVENTTISSGGADDEDADSLRERIRQAPEKFSNAGSRGAYRYHTLSAHQSITDVAITSPSAGIVAIYLLTKDGNPTEEIIKIVQNYLSDDKIRPLTDCVKVYSSEKVDFEIKAKIYLYKDSDADSVMKTIEAKMKEYKISLSEKLGKDVIQTQIISILNSIYGVFKVVLETPITDIDILEYQWANLTNWNISIGGYADE